MYKIRFTNDNYEVVTTTIENKKDLKKIATTGAINSIIECSMSSGMPTSLHNVIAEHNKRVREGSSV